MIDEHLHLNRFDESIVVAARRADRRLTTINVEWAAFGSIEEQAAAAMAYRQADPDHFRWITTFSTGGWTDPGWAERTTRWLEHCFDAGAAGVKIWKNIGMSLRDTDGTPVLPDDPRLDVVAAAVRRHGKMIVLHVGDPSGCWTRLEDIAIAGDREFYQQNPEQHAHGRSDVPNHAQLIAAAEVFLGRHRDVVVSGAHLLSLDHDLDRLEALLGRHPNLVVDTAARMEHLRHHTRSDEHRTIGFLRRQWRRIRYGSDLMAPTAGELEQVWRDDQSWFREAGLGAEEIAGIFGASGLSYRTPKVSKCS